MIYREEELHTVLNNSIGDDCYEGASVSESKMREVQDCKAQRQNKGYLYKSKTQAKARLTFIWRLYG